jgi:hypothetical protein
MEHVLDVGGNSVVEGERGTAADGLLDEGGELGGVVDELVR